MWKPKLEDRMPTAALLCVHGSELASARFKRQSKDQGLSMSTQRLPRPPSAVARVMCICIVYGLQAAAIPMNHTYLHAAHSLQTPSGGRLAGNERARGVVR